MSADFKSKGFESSTEYYEMLQMVDISFPESRKKLLEWKKNDGTKEGLKKLLP